MEIFHPSFTYTQDIAALQDSDMVQCILRLKVDAVDTRVPMHFIMLIDNSGSMQEEDKLKNVKKCIHSMMLCLQATDYFSIVTFESHSKIHCNHMAATAANKSFVQTILQEIQPEDMTNLSAGIGNVKKILENSPEKTGLLILTDGHVNKGVVDSPTLLTLIQSLQSNCAGIAIHCIGYGTDHNSGLLNNISMETNGSYNIVNNIEDVATAFGDTIGGLMSCVAQNVYITIPNEVVVEGPLKKDVKDGVTTIQIGDIYSGTEKIVLCSMQKQFVDSGRIVFHGMKLPLFDSFTFSPAPTLCQDRDIEVELTRHRYTCAALLRDLQTTAHNSYWPVDSINELRTRIDAFQQAVEEPFYDNHPIGTQLRGEVSLLRQALQNITAPVIDMDAVINQHTSYYGLGRGFSSPMHANRHRRSISPAFSYTRGTGCGRYCMPSDPVEDGDDCQNEDPNTGIQSRQTPVTTSVFQNYAQRMVSNTLRTQSQRPDDDLQSDDEDE